MEEKLITTDMTATDITIQQPVFEYSPMRGTEKKKRDLQMLIHCLPETNEGLIGIEIGSFAGESSEIFAASGKFRKLYCVDPWMPNYYSKNSIPNAEKRFDFIAEKYISIIRKEKMTADVFFKNCDLLLVDFIYIDGNHNYDFVKRDILNAISLLKKTKGLQILSGHDYKFPRSPGVERAVKEIVEYPDIRFPYYSWIKFLDK